MRLNQYLQKIEQGKVINLECFITCLPFLDPQQWRDIYQAERVRGGYLLDIIDVEKHQALYKTIAQDRVEAAYQGSSHDFTTSFSHILVLNQYCVSQIPVVVLSTNSGFKCAGKLLGKQAVIIENQENFYRYQDFLAAIGVSNYADDCDILLGAGNQICHGLNRGFLATYDVIYCAQDLDLGGLTIFQTLRKTLPQCFWLAPNDWAKYREQFKLLPKNAIQLAKAIQLARDLGLSQEADTMNQTRAFLEQEALLPMFFQD
ncbi:Wadjet anti-phage system protein JetD domain-containing protein [Photobacterium carnosum]|uniref:Wadjet anti-phage system protein JetD domain-containing protein n=2 Tax=Photobacterium carnosum TaxID=2023717 RepID=UPI001E5D2574|nr:Wadjet anti-phage system protein JetD domain-containing protein [Photobacterium carnosum]MCD9514230.1 hypothetical protein [Photobacterium carnosum]MCD9530868.1 hypothetical protein [Photobacterium carnosum]MCF2154530.1 hypothetical protein [Photobacterium carnosum]MCF2216379.1 hypothetical protein [Photobacterium carnosum]